MKRFLCVLCVATAAALALPVSSCKKENEETERGRYAITAAYYGGNTVESVCEFSFYNSTDEGIETLEFNLWGNAYRKDATYAAVNEADSAFYSGESYGGESVESVTGCESFEIGGEDENLLYVHLDEAIFPGERHTVTINYTLTLANVNHRTGLTESGVNLGNFYPQLCAYFNGGYAENPYYSLGDPFVAECADYEVKLKLPKGYVAATSGIRQSARADGEYAEYVFSLDCARDFAAVLYKNAKTLEKSVNGTAVTLYYTGESAPQTVFLAVCESFEYFSDAFGEYAYPTFTAAYVPLNVSGMEYPCLTMISDSLSESDAVYAAVHETAHQWWYSMVGSDQVNESWQDEGLAEYSTLCFFAENPVYGYTKTAMLGSAIKAYRGYYSVYSQLFGETDTTMSRSLKDFSGEYEYVNIAYNKGLLLFENLHAAMGGEKFFKALRSYFDDCKFTIAAKEQLIARFAALHDTEGVFDSFLNGKVVI